eukprot:TRINITY_DN752_c0_g1_i10.p2 TRINITY_DN752_c0_g1~~TRINITY_DN752_c0_g1_i10.p2  ORF type:complete len:100 (+),score=26.66 TRINITY_DN752_c0_g1_i10:44-301(+)
MLRSLVGSEMCIRDRYQRRVRDEQQESNGQGSRFASTRRQSPRSDTPCRQGGGQEEAAPWPRKEAPSVQQAFRQRCPWLRQEEGT